MTAQLALVDDDPAFTGYLETLREPEYAGLLETARENLRLGVNVLVVGPLSRELREGLLFDRGWLGVDDDVGVHVDLGGTRPGRSQSSRIGSLLAGSALKSGWSRRLDHPRTASEGEHP